MAPSVRTQRISRSEMMRMPSHKPKAWFGCRHVQVLLMTLGFLCCYATRVTLSVAVEAMIKRVNENSEVFNWDISQKNAIIGSFFWGYICTQVLGSVVGSRYGAQRLFCWALLICGVATVLTPAAAHFGGWMAVCAIRVISGFCQGNIMPSLHILLSKWVPRDERGTLASFVYSGGWIGNVISLMSSGALSASPLGWSSCFYIWGSIMIISSILSMTFGKESPADDPKITLEEREYIELSLGVTETKEHLSTPWKAIMTSVPVWALLATQCAQAWGFWMLLTKIPAYMGSVMKYDIKDNGILTALPYLMAWILSFPFGYFSDLAIRKELVSTEVSRKICNSIGEWIPALAFVGLGYVGSDQKELAEAILILAVGMNIAIYCGHNVNHIDLSPNFAGHLMGITNTAANICSILIPFVATYIVPNETDQTQWRTMFFISAVIYVLGNLTFILFGTSDVQKWNDPVPKSINNMAIYQISESPVESSKAEKIDEAKIP